MENIVDKDLVRQTKKAYHRQWQKLNKEKVKQAQIRYWQKKAKQKLDLIQGGNSEISKADN